MFLDAPGHTTARVQPVVLLSIIDHHSRRNENQHRVIGTLLGSVVDGVVDIRGCLPVPHNEDEEQVAVDMDHARSLFELHNRVSPRDHIVGWYATGGIVNDHSELIQQFFSSETARPVHLLVDTRLGEGNPIGNGIGARCFSCPEGALDRPLGPHFDEIPLAVASDAADRAGVAALIQATVANAVPSLVGGPAGLEDAGEDGDMVSELDQLESALVRLRGQLQVVEKYAESAASGKSKGDEGIGRDLALAVSEVPMVDPAEFEAALSTGTQDLLMVVYLSDLIKTQLGIAEKLEKLV